MHSIHEGLLTSLYRRIGGEGGGVLGWGGEIEEGGRGKGTVVMPELGEEHVDPLVLHVHWHLPRKYGNTLEFNIHIAQNRYASAATATPDCWNPYLKCGF